MLTLAVVALVCGTVLLIGHRAEGALVAKWRAERLSASVAREESLTIEQRRMAVAEREIALKERQFEQLSKPPTETEPMPPELEARIFAWEDDWAQENERQNITTLYAKLGDWDKVRQQLVPLAMSTTAGDVIHAPREGLIQ